MINVDNISLDFGGMSEDLHILSISLIVTFDLRVKSVVSSFK